MERGDDVRVDQLLPLLFGIEPILKVYLSFSDENEQTDQQVVDEETAQEKRLRLAKQYLAQLEKEGILEKRY